MTTAVLVGTLDTKGREYGFVRDRLRDRGIDVVLIDVGVLGQPTVAPDVSASEVAAAAGAHLDELRFAREGSDTRAVALETMRDGARAIVDSLRRDGRCDGALGLGGSGGSALISAVLRSLPLGVPKVLVSTMASGDVSAYVGASDLCLMHSVTDIAGLNRISRPILSNAAFALAGMLTGRPSELVPEPDQDRPAVAVTMLGVTTPAALRVVDRLDEGGFDAITFHAVGSGGRALEQLLDQGVFAGVIDLTVKELTDEHFGGLFRAGDERLRTAGRAGIPQVIVPGAIEVLNFGPLDSVPAGLVDGSRPIVRHNDQVTAVRLSRSELVGMAGVLAARVNASRGPTVVVVPMGGFDGYAQADGPFWNPDDDAAFVDALVGQLTAPPLLIDAHINDKRFADALVDAFHHLVTPYRGAQE
ncbi:MAG: Tm-1-like ATP-binding domain-containing protein [Solirubrobacteraceae bacterium]|nr:Tm-1-like ATP-binding domain-containing protein [Solirubrobacteraceae bacterium]